MKVFISHSSRNKRVAARLGDDLGGERINVWLDRNELHSGDPLLDDPSAKNGLGNIYWLRRDLDAAEFFVSQAVARAGKMGIRYEAAEHDLEGIREEKATLRVGGAPDRGNSNS